jgi:hypothetical protein
MDEYMLDGVFHFSTSKGRGLGDGGCGGKALKMSLNKNKLDNILDQIFYVF